MCVLLLSVTVLLLTVSYIIGICFRVGDYDLEHGDFSEMDTANPINSSRYACIGDICIADRMLIPLVLKLLHKVSC